MHADMTIVKTQSNEVVLNDVKATQVTLKPLQPSYVKTE